MSDKLTTSLTVLLTGFAVVFAVLLILIGVIKLYGSIVYNLQNKSSGKQEKKASPEQKPRTVTIDPSPAARPALIPAAADETEIIAVISAAVYSTLGSGVRIKSIRKSSKKSAAWRDAGLSDLTRPF